MYIYEPKINCYRLKKTKLLHEHKRESRLRKVLNNIFGRENVFEEVCFDWCVNPETDCYLRFDFCVILSETKFFLVEFHGEQHFKQNKFFHNKKEFNEQIKRDKIKKDCAKKQKIPLVIISYKEPINTKNITRILQYFNIIK